MRTAIIYHPDCRKHKMVQDHPECSERSRCDSRQIASFRLRYCCASDHDIKSQ